MTSKALVEEFIGQKSLAVVGVSRDPKKFGNTVYKELKQKGYEVLAVNPKTEEIDGDPVYANLKALPKKVGGVVVVVPPKVTEQVVQEAAEAGIERIWLQQGAESKTVLRLCEEKGLKTVSRECILMFAEPVASIHKFHRWIWKLFGKLPK